MIFKLCWGYSYWKESQENLILKQWTPTKLFIMEKQIEKCSKHQKTVDKHLHRINFWFWTKNTHRQGPKGGPMALWCFHTRCIGCKRLYSTFSQPPAGSGRPRLHRVLEKLDDGKIGSPNPLYHVGKNNVINHPFGEWFIPPMYGDLMVKANGKNPWLIRWIRLRLFSLRMLEKLSHSFNQYWVLCFGRKACCHAFYTKWDHQAKLHIQPWKLQNKPVVSDSKTWDKDWTRKLFITS